MTKAFFFYKMDGERKASAMKLQPAVKQETRKIALGVAALSAVMLLVFLAIGRFDLSVLLGALLGAAAAIGNFFLMAISVQQVAEERAASPAEEDSAQADKAVRRKMQLSYTGRMLLLGGVAVLALLLPCFQPVAAVLPFLFPRAVIALEGLMMKKKESQGT